MFASLLAPSFHPSPAAPAQVAANPEVSCVSKCVPRGHLSCPVVSLLVVRGSATQACSIPPCTHFASLHSVCRNALSCPGITPPSGLPVLQDMGDHPLFPQGRCPAHVAPTTHVKYAGPSGARPAVLTVNPSTCRGVPPNAIGINAWVLFPLASKMGIQGYTKS